MVAIDVSKNWTVGYGRRGSLWQCCDGSLHHCEGFSPLLHDVQSKNNTIIISTFHHSATTSRVESSQSLLLLSSECEILTKKRETKLFSQKWKRRVKHVSSMMLLSHGLFGPTLMTTVDTPLFGLFYYRELISIRKAVERLSNKVRSVTTSL